MKGYMTVEASMVLPVAFGVIMFVMSLLFYSYDRCLLEQEAAALIVHNEYLKGEDLEEKARNVNEAIRGWYLDKYVWMDIEVPEMEVMANGIQVTAEGAFRGPFFGIVRVEREEVRLSPVFLIRQKMKLQKSEEKGEGEDEYRIY